MGLRVYDVSTRKPRMVQEYQEAHPGRVSTVLSIPASSSRSQARGGIIIASNCATGLAHYELCKEGNVAWLELVHSQATSGYVQAAARGHGNCVVSEVTHRIRK